MNAWVNEPTKFERVTFMVGITGFIGGSVLEVLRRMLGWSEAKFLASTAGDVSLVFQGLFMLAMLVLFPVAYFIRRRTHPDLSPVVSRWVSWPLTALLFFFLALLLFGLTAASINAYRPSLLR